MSTASKSNRTTPGPWRVVSHFTGPLEIVAENKQIVAMVASEIFGEAVANAELIAIAPELRDALKEIVSALHDAGYNVKLISGDNAHLVRITQAFSAALPILAKAENH